ncbi:MAG: hypothetical protein ACP6IS_11775 [Candidatus Asgardarchaeia archaeon]
MSKKVVNLTIGLNTIIILWIFLLRHYLIKAIDGYSAGWVWYEALPVIYSNIDYITLLIVIALIINTALVSVCCYKHS